MGRQVSLQLRNTMLVERRERLVENPQRRRRKVESRKPDTTLLSGRKGVAGHVFETAQSYGSKRLPDRFATCRLMQRTQPGQVFFCGKQALDAGSVPDPQQVAGQLATLRVEWLTNVA